MVDALRTPDSRFADLPGYALAPHYFLQEWGEEVARRALAYFASA